MATIHKCDKCGKILKTNQFGLNITDWDRSLMEKSYNSFEFCEKCVKPLTVYLKKFLAKKSQTPKTKKIKNHNS